VKIYHVIQSDKAHLSDSRVTDISEGFTHKMAVKISHHRYGTKLRHCQPMYLKTEWWGAGVVICLVQCAVLHTAQQMPLPLTVTWFSKIQIGFTFIVPAHPGSPGQRAVKRVCVCQPMYSLSHTGVDSDTQQ